MHGPDLRLAEPRRQPRPRSRESARARSRTTRPAPCRASPSRGARPIRVRKDVHVRQRRRSRYDASCSKSASVSPGNPTMTSEPIEACGIRARMPSTSARVLLDACTAGASPPAPGRWRAAAAGGNAARSTAASRDEIDDLRRAVHRLERADAEQHVGDRVADGQSISARSSSISDDGGVRSRPYEPRCTPVSAISLKPAATTRSTSASTSASGTLRGAPRVVGMMQYEHGSAQPVCTRSVNAVRPATPGSIAAPQLPSPSPKRSAVVDQAETSARQPADRDQLRLVVVGHDARRRSAGRATSSGRRVA